MTKNSRNRMATVALGTALLTALPGTPVRADDATAPIDPLTSERGQRLADATGLGGGALVGGLVAGPVGAIVGAGLGTWLGGRVVKAGRAEEAGELLSQTRADLTATQRALAESGERADRLAQALAASEGQLVELAAAADRARRANVELREALAAGLELQVMFRTGESELLDASAAQLEALGRALGDIEGLAVRLDGHADPRGDVAFNADLAARRAAAVKAALLAGGLAEGSVETFAHGEATSEAESGDLDAYALERRVDVSLLSVQSPDGAGEAPAAAVALGSEQLSEVDVAAVLE